MDILGDVEEGQDAHNAPSKGKQALGKQKSAELELAPDESQPLAQFSQDAPQ